MESESKRSIRCIRTGRFYPANVTKLIQEEYHFGNEFNNGKSKFNRLMR